MYILRRLSGIHLILGSCSDCPAGTLSGIGQSSCTNCSPGKYSASGSSSCPPCVANHYCPGGTYKIPCPDGSISNPGAASCTSCMLNPTSDEVMEKLTDGSMTTSVKFVKVRICQHLSDDLIVIHIFEKKLCFFYQTCSRREIHVTRYLF